MLSREPHPRKAGRQESDKQQTFSGISPITESDFSAVRFSVLTPAERNGQKIMNEQNKNNRYRTFGRMVSRGSDKSPALYAIRCGKLTAAEICRLLSKRGLDEVATITAAGKPLDGLRAVWSCYTIAAENGFTTPYDSEVALAAKSSIDKLDERKATLNAVNRKISAAKKTAEVIYRANNPEPQESDYPNGGIAAAREAWFVALVAARNNAETPEMREAYNTANEAYNLEKITYVKSCLNFDSAYMKALDERRAGLSPLKQCGEDNSNN